MLAIMWYNSIWVCCSIAKGSMLKLAKYCRIKHTRYDRIDDALLISYVFGGGL
jgi:hypothetical protein